MNKSVKNKKKVLSPQEKQKREEKREHTLFKKKIVSVFKDMWFEYLKVEWKEKKFWHKIWELDYVFLYKNILLICEDTTSNSHQIMTHFKNKSILFDQIMENKKELLEWLKEDYPDTFSKFQTYSDSRYNIFCLYIPKCKLELSEDDKKLYNNCTIIEEDTLNYFSKISKNIKYSAKNELFRFLDIKGRDIWISNSHWWTSNIDTIIISPEDNTSLKSWARVVSFMMSAEKLLNNAYVLRKDSWTESSQLYQRLIEKWRIDWIRSFLALNKETFINNIIVSLPNNIIIKDEKDNIVKLENISNFNWYKMSIPDEINSICIIDWQHRIYAHYEWNDKYEPIIKELREKLHLLVTWLIFPESLTDNQRIKYESEIFLNINSNARPVPPDVLLHIETIKDPFSPVWIARKVLENLNKNAPFKDLLQLSLMKKSKIKIPSIIKFALKYIVEINLEKETFFKYWDNKDKNLLLKDTKTKEESQKKEELLKEYILFISGYLAYYFNALKSNFNTDWHNEDSKILSITSINWFIIALRESLKFTWVKNIDYYKNEFSKLQPKINFEKSKFVYTSSQYNKFAQNVILKECFNK